MQVPGYAQSPAVRTTTTSRPGMRPAGTRPGPARNAPQNAFAQALAQANAQNLALRHQLMTANPAVPAEVGAPFGQQSGLPAQFQAQFQAMTSHYAPATSGAFLTTPVGGTVPAAVSAPVTAMATAQTPGVLQLPGGFGPIVAQAGQKYGVDPALIAAVIETESKFNPDAVSQAGARGLMQLMPATARGLGVTDASDPLQNVLGGAKLLGQLTHKYNGNLELALAAYNAGSGAVDKHGGIPPYAETRKYVPLVLSAYERFRAQAGTPAPATPVAPAHGR